MTALSNIKIAGKLYALVFLVIAGMIGAVGIDQYQTGKVVSSANFASDSMAPSFNTLHEVRGNFQELRIAALYHVLSTDEARMVALNREIQDRREAIAKHLAHYQDKLILNAEDKRRLDEVSAAIKDFYQEQESTLNLSRQGKSAEAKANAERIAPLAIRVQEALQRHLDFKTGLATEGNADVLATRKYALWTTASFTALMIFLLGIFSWVIVNRELAGPIGSIVDSLKLLAGGCLEATITGTTRRDEVGDIARATMVFKEFVQKLNTQSWIKTHESEISAALQHAEDFKSLAQTAISKIASVINAGHGTIYVADSENRFTLLGSYGYREGKHLNNSFIIGEGLIGQAAMEKAAITLRAPKDYIQIKVPKDYIQINSGLGESTPACVAVRPIVHQHRLLAMIEVASFEQFSEREIALLDALLPTLATNMEIIERNQRNKDLLAAMREQAEHMEKQAAQLEEQQVEMGIQHVEFMESEDWFRSIIEAVPDGILVVRDDGIIVLANPTVETLFGYGFGELISMPLARIISADVLTARRSSIVENISGLHKDGREFPIDLSLNPLPACGKRGPCVSIAVQTSNTGG